MTTNGEGASAPLFPLFLDLSAVPVVVVGAGTVAERKVRALLSSGARVCLVAPDARTLARRLEGAPGPGSLECVERAFEEGDLAEARLVFAATDSSEVNAGIARLARERGAFVNVADSSRLSSAHVPATLSRGEHLSIAISTRGASPRLGGLLRRVLDARLEREWGAVTTLLAELRAWWDPLAKERGLTQPERQTVWEALVEEGLAERCARMGEEPLRDELRASLAEALERRRQTR